VSTHEIGLALNALPKLGLPCVLFKLLRARSKIWSAQRTLLLLCICITRTFSGRLSSNLELLSSLLKIKAPPYNAEKCWSAQRTHIASWIIYRSLHF
jgi:hypothetical protein